MPFIRQTFEVGKLINTAGKSIFSISRKEAGKNLLQIYKSKQVAVPLRPQTVTYALNHVEMWHNFVFIGIVGGNFAVGKIRGRGEKNGLKQRLMSHF